jgi:hypothetical protein
LNVDIPASGAIDSYTMSELPGIPVSNGQIEVFFWTYATAAGKWTTWDDFELVKE